MPAPVSPEAKRKTLAEKFPEWVWGATAMPKTSSEKFSLACPEHGLFQVTYNHLTRQGRPNPCPKCSKRVGSGKIKFLEAEHGKGLDVMRQIKQALDPLNIMNPGKILAL